MRATARSGALAALIAGCGAEPPVPRLAEPCAAYPEGSDALAYCLVTQVHRAATVAEVEALCAHAGDHEAACRTAWVGDHARGDDPSPEALLRLCAEDVCRFDVLEAHPSADLLVQVEACARWTGALAPDCVGHAAQRWVRARPSAAEIGRVVAAGGAEPALVAVAVGQALGCGGEGDCAGYADPRLARECDVARRQAAATPSVCRVGGPPALGPSAAAGVRSDPVPGYGGPGDR